MNIRKIVLSAFFIALGVVLPFVTMQIPAIGNMLLPMHIPVLLCGFICGAPYGAFVGFVLPLLRSILFGAPPMMPTAVAMSVELLIYGLASGVLFNIFKNKKCGFYLTLIPTMILGRIVWGITSFILFVMLGNTFTWQIFVTQAFAKAIPGILIQLIIIPVIIINLRKSGVEEFLNGNEGNMQKKV